MKATWLHGCISHRLSGISDSLSRDHELRWISGVKVFLRRAQGKPLPNLVRVSPSRHVFSFAVSMWQTALGAVRSPAEKRAHDARMGQKTRAPSVGNPVHNSPRCVNPPSEAALVTRAQVDAKFDPDRCGAVAL